MAQDYIGWDDFTRVELRVGTIRHAEVNAQARKPAYIVHADFGPDFGVLKTSAQITDLYAPDDLIGRQILGVVNFPPKQIGAFRSEFLLTGFYREDGAVVLAVPDQAVPDGAKLV